LQPVVILQRIKPSISYLSHPAMSSVHRVHPDRCCYHNISWTAWTISMKLTRNIH